MKTYSTAQAARLAAIHPLTLFKWRKAGKVKASQSIATNGSTFWRYTEKDIEKIRRYKERFFRKGRGRKKKK